MAQALFYLGVGDSGVGFFSRLVSHLAQVVVNGVDSLGAATDQDGAITDAGKDIELREALWPVVAVPDDAVGALVAAAFARAGVHPIDARIEAPDLLGPTHEATAAGLAAILAQSSSAKVVTVHHPCLAQFTPACRVAARAAGFDPLFVLYTRRPAASIDPTGLWYGESHGLSHRTAGWVNTMLAAEAATRQERRVVVCHEHVLRDWITQVTNTAVTLGIPVLRRAEPQHTAAVNQHHVNTIAAMVPPELERSFARLASLDIAPDLVALTSRVDEALRRLSAEPDWPDVVEFDVLRQNAALAYQRALSWTSSSTLPPEEIVLGEQRPSTRVPHGVRRLIPAPVRRLAH